MLKRKAVQVSCLLFAAFIMCFLSCSREHIKTEDTSEASLKENSTQTGISEKSSTDQENARKEDSGAKSVRTGTGEEEDPETGSGYEDSGETDKDHLPGGVKKSSSEAEINTAEKKTTASPSGAAETENKTAVSKSVTASAKSQSAGSGTEKPSEKTAVNSQSTGQTSASSSQVAFEDPVSSSVVVPADPSPGRDTEEETKEVSFSVAESAETVVPTEAVSEETAEYDPVSDKLSRCDEKILEGINEARAEYGTSMITENDPVLSAYAQQSVEHMLSACHACHEFFAGTSLDFAACEGTSYGNLINTDMEPGFEGYYIVSSHVPKLGYGSSRIGWAWGYDEETGCMALSIWGDCPTS